MTLRDKPKIFTVLLLVFSLSLSACMGPVKVQRIELARIKNPEKEKIAGLTTVKSEDVLFDRPNGTFAAGVVKGTVRNAPYSIPADQVERLWVARREFSPGRTTGLVVGVAAGVIAIAAIVVVANPPKLGCPFVYSWDGSEYVFDGEMYGGSVTRGMERDDTTELGHLRPQGGLYRIALTDEMEETEYTNQTELWVVDHPAGTRVAADESGKLYTLSDSRPPTAARDENGVDLLPLLASKDEKVWAPEPAMAPDGSVRHEIVMTFPRPVGAKETKLLVSGGTAPWGIAMITELFGLYGQGAAMKLASLDNSPSDLKALQAWSTREDVYMLRVWVKEPSGWHVRGVIPGGGASDRVIPLDLSRAVGEQVQIRIQPPGGFWSLNSFAMDYSPEVPVTVQKVAAQTARMSSGTDVAPLLAATDDQYYVAKKGDRAELEFTAPADSAEASRTIFLHSRGYYRPDVPSQGPANTKALREIFRERDGLARFASARYAEWRAAQGVVN